MEFVLGTNRQIYGCDVDVIFVLDESSSITRKNFDLMKSFVSQLVGRLDVDSRKTLVGLVCFSNYVHIQDAFNLNVHSSVASVQLAISELAYDKGLTRTDTALCHVREKMLTTAAGDRPEVPNVVILLADGHSTYPNETLVCTLAGNRLFSLSWIYVTVLCLYLGQCSVLLVSVSCPTAFSFAF